MKFFYHERTSIESREARNPAAVDEMVFLSSIPDRRTNKNLDWVGGGGGGRGYHIHIYIYTEPTVSHSVRGTVFLRRLRNTKCHIWRATPLNPWVRAA